MRPIDKLKEIIKEFKESTGDLSLEDFENYLTIKYNTPNYWLKLALECGFLTSAECRRTSQWLFD